MPIKVVEIDKRIRDKRGNIAAVARSFGVTRKAIYDRIHKSAKLQATLEESREVMLDNAETELYDQALDGNTTALIFFLKTQGKRRGYVERSEITGADGNKIILGWGDDANA